MAAFRFIAFGGLAVAAAVVGADSTPSDSQTTPSLPDAGEVVTATVDTLAIAFAAFLGLLVGLVLSFVLQGVLRFVVRRHPLARTAVRAIGLPLKFTLALVGAWVGMGIGWDVPAGEAEPWLRGTLNHAFIVAVIFGVTWLVAALFDGVERTVVNHMHESGQARYRKVQTQLQILHRIVLVVIWVLGFALVLMTFPSARTLGTTLFTSAGLLSVVIGIAAQSTLGNVFAGLQLAFSDSIRMGDIVIWQKEFTTVEEITLTYVVLKVWDGRRLIVPSSQMTTSTFENWTRRTPDLLGYVDFELDWSAPIPQMRAELNAILDRTDLWDGNTGILQVRDATAGRLQVSILLSAENASKLTDLKYYVREHMVRWIQQEAPTAVPHNRSFNPEDRALEEAQESGQDTGSSDQKDVPADTGSSEPAQERMSGLSPRTKSKGNIAASSRRASQAHIRQGVPNPKGVGNQKGAGSPRKTGTGLAKVRPSTLDQAETTVMGAQEIAAELPIRVPIKQRGLGENGAQSHPDEGHESSIFTGSIQAERRAQQFAGPGEDVIKEREDSLERQKTSEQEKIQAESSDVGEEEPKEKRKPSENEQKLRDTSIMGALSDD